MIRKWFLIQELFKQHALGEDKMSSNFTSWSLPNMRGGPLRAEQFDLNLSTPSAGKTQLLGQHLSSPLCFCSSFIPGQPDICQVSRLGRYSNILFLSYPHPNSNPQHSQLDPHAQKQDSKVKSVNTSPSHLSAITKFFQLWLNPVDCTGT